MGQTHCLVDGNKYVVRLNSMTETKAPEGSDPKSFPVAYRGRFAEDCLYLPAEAPPALLAYVCQAASTRPLTTIDLRCQSLTTVATTSIGCPRRSPCSAIWNAWICKAILCPTGRHQLGSKFWLTDQIAAIARAQPCQQQVDCHSS